VRLSVVSDSVNDALVVPAAAILTGADGATTAMVVGPDQKAHQTAIKTGIRQEDNVQIVEGLKEGQSVVVAGAYGLPDNTKITVEEAKEKEADKDDKDKDKETDKPSAGSESAAKDSGKGEKE
jgi:multidrug efflux pump subunit AcrA (membrane-fusion protein)